VPQALGVGVDAYDREKVYERGPVDGFLLYVLV
jgi:hypothetical protein